VEGGKKVLSFMPPKSLPTPDIIFVSDEKPGALFHHTRLDDIVDLLLEHVKCRALFEDLPQDPSGVLFEFSMMQIDCEPSLKFIKKSIMYHPELFFQFLQSFHSRIGCAALLDQSLVQLPSALPHILQLMKDDLKKEIGEIIETLFEGSSA
jgi:hypothetical protein